jgi:hypothetical protein
LLYLAEREDTGWPPPDPLGHHPWTHILSDKPVTWWSKVQWQLQKVDGVRYCAPKPKYGEPQTNPALETTSVGSARRLYQIRLASVSETGHEKENRSCPAALLIAALAAGGLYFAHMQINDRSVS